MSFLRTLAAFGYTIFVIISFLPFGLLAAFIRLFCLKKQMTSVIFALGRAWAIGIVAMTGCQLTVEGKENIPASGGVCFASNHVGVFDILLALALINRPFGFIAKKELLRIPLLNIWISILGGLFIDRKNIRNAVKTINLGIKKLQRGGCMLIFPEGTRSKGRGLLPFRSGAVKLATNSQAPIIPVAISGSYDVFEKNYRVHAVPVRVVFCPAIDSSKMSAEDRRHKLADQVRSVIEAALESGEE